MSAKAIREYDGKILLSKHLGEESKQVSKIAQINLPAEFFKDPETGRVVPDATFTKLQNLLDALPIQHPWLLAEKLVVKPDQLIKRRGKSGLILLNADWGQVRHWVTEKVGRVTKVGEVEGILRTFVVEPFIPHDQSDESYVCIQAKRDGDEILFCTQGGIDVGDVDSKAIRYLVPVFIDKPDISESVIEEKLLYQVQGDKKKLLAKFIVNLYNAFTTLQFTYLEINPVVVVNNLVHFLDLAAKLDQTAEFECSKLWGEIEFPGPFGRELTKEEAYVRDLDSKTGASLKLTILNKNGRIWTMVAGGGASVAYTDAIASLGYASELANYGEYSGAPSETQTYEYSKTILDLMTREHDPKGKVLIIGGGIANFTNVATTFKGIIRSIKEFKDLLLERKVEIYVRRGGPNYQEGLKLMAELGESLGINIHVFGPEAHITAVVPFALNGDVSALTSKMGTDAPVKREDSYSDLNKLLTGDKSGSIRSSTKAIADPTSFYTAHSTKQKLPYELFTAESRSFVFGMQTKAVQGMLDFDHMCKRAFPSVAAMIYPFGGTHVQKFYWGTNDVLVPVFQNSKDAMEKFPDVDTVINFASCRSVYETTMELMTHPQIKVIAIIAEGVPEKRARQLIKVAASKGITIIGPATVGGIKPGCFKIGNTGGMTDNIVASKLYRQGSVSYVSKSGGMSNELNNIVSRVTDGVYEGIAIGGDRYPGTTFIDHLLRYEQDPNCRIHLLLGEVGGVEEYRVIDAVKSGKIKKPIVAWCIGVCSSMFATEVQFGHAGACASSDLETAGSKNKAMREAGIVVPNSFEELPSVLGKVYDDLVKRRIIVPMPEPEVPKVPMDYAWAHELGLIRKPANFVSTICDDRGQELLYAGMPISAVFKEDIGIGGVLSLLWFKRRLPDYACKFIEMVLMLTADHGPAVSGAHNTIVTARAGKDLVSSLTSGLLTIGDRFGGALDGAAAQFSKGYDEGQTPQEFVDSMRKQKKLIMGIGHKIKSKTNPDLRVTIITDFAKEHFPQTPILDFALKVEEITTAKKDSLILNVDGAIGVLMVDLLRHSGAFSLDEAEEYIKIGLLNGLFVLGRSIGFIGHFLDQKRLKQGLYRHPWEDISYLTDPIAAKLAGTGNDDE